MTVGWRVLFNWKVYCDKTQISETFHCKIAKLVMAKSEESLKAFGTEVNYQKI